MGAITTITLADGADTPVNHDFIPNKIDGDVAFYHEKSAAIVAGYYPLTISHRPSNGGSDVSRSKLSLAMPTVVTDANGVQSVSHTNRVNIEFIVSDKSTLTEREDLRAFAANLLAHSVVTDVVENGNNLY